MKSNLAVPNLLIFFRGWIQKSHIARKNPTIRWKHRRIQENTLAFSNSLPILKNSMSLPSKKDYRQSPIHTPHNNYKSKRYILQVPQVCKTTEQPKSTNACKSPITINAYQSLRLLKQGELFSTEQGWRNNRLTPKTVSIVKWFYYTLSKTTVSCQLKKLNSIFSNKHTIQIRARATEHRAQSAWQNLSVQLNQVKNEWNCVLRRRLYNVVHITITLYPVYDGKKLYWNWIDWKTLGRHAGSHSVLGSQSIRLLRKSSQHHVV